MGRFRKVGVSGLVEMLARLGWKKDTMKSIRCAIHLAAAIRFSLSQCNCASCGDFQHGDMCKV